MARNAEGTLSSLDNAECQMVYLRTKKPIADPHVLTGRGRTHVLLWPQEQEWPAYFDELDISNL